MCTPGDTAVSPDEEIECGLCEYPGLADMGLYNVGDGDGLEADVPKHGFRPSPEEVEKHNATHIPFRSWCSHCVKGKGVKAPHRHDQAHEERNVTTM